MNYPKASIIRDIEGDLGHRTKKQKEKVEFYGPDKPPSIPRDLDDDGRIYWKRLVKTYMITEADVPEYAYVCQLYSEIKKMEKVIQEEGYFFLKITVDGAGQEHQEKREHPASKRLDALRKEKRVAEKGFIVRANAAPKKYKKNLQEELIN